MKSLAWLPDDTKLVSAGVDGAVYEWRLKDFKRSKEKVLKASLCCAVLVLCCAVLCHAMLCGVVWCDALHHYRPNVAARIICWIFLISYVYMTNGNVIY